MYSKSDLNDFAARLRAFIHASVSSFEAGMASPENGEQEFGMLASELFALQLQHNSAYRHFCDSRGSAPAGVRRWRDVPAISTAAFKELDCTCLPANECKRVFFSSGTTEQSPSRHFHNEDSLRIYEASLWAWFRTLVLSRAIPARIVCLTPTPEAATNSSLVHMFETVRQRVGVANSTFVSEVMGDGGWNVKFPMACETLREAVASKEPVLVLGTAFAYVQMLDYLETQNWRLELPTGSQVLETGGYKGRSRTLPKSTLHSLICQRLGVPPDDIICEYGMSELSSQAYSLSSPAQHGRTPGPFIFPPWTRFQIISPENGEELGEGETGLLRVFDLANVYSVMAIQTEDLAIRRGQGFELVGRANLAEARGCSLMSVP